MPRFNNGNTKELKEFLYNSCIHDAILESVRYEHGDDSIKIEVFNPTFNVKMELTFRDIGIALAIRGNELGSRETIISLTVEENLSYLENYIHMNSESIKGSLYLLFQMFSGDEFHLVSREVIVEVPK